MIKPDAQEATYLNRRNAIKAFSIAGLSTLSATAMAGTAVPAPAKKISYTVYSTIAELKQDAALKENSLVRTVGYYTAGDGGGAEYIIRKEKPVAEECAIALSGELYAALINVDSVNYKMFGAVCDGKNDDGIQVKQAHEYANLKEVPVINHSGEFWIKGTNSIPVQTNIHWGQTVFHVDEKFGSAQGSLFIVLSKEKQVAIELDAATRARLIAQLRPGVKLIPELAPYKNTLVIITDMNDKIGYRSGEAYGGKVSKAKEEFFFVEEHGRILGDIAWEFSDYTSLVAYPGNDAYLIIDGGTFYMSGETPTTKVSLYIQIGFSVRRSRTIIRNQWVGLEKGMPDVSMVPKGGFYNFLNAYDVLLENVRLIPWEKDRPGTDKDVKEGTYGIGGTRVLNATFRNVCAEGSPIHWGVFGTNLFKNFRVEQCVLNRIDVHFHCWNLYIKDSKIGSNGITVTGGGDLFVENTTCMSSSFIAFRRDFGGKWDGDIRIRNCRHAPITMGPTAILAFDADNFDYKYPIGYGRTVKVEDMIVDFRTVPASTSASWLMRTTPFSIRKDGDRLFFPSHLEFKNILVEGREQGLRLIQIAEPQNYKLPKPGGCDTVQLKPNCRMIFEDVQLEKFPAEEAQSDTAHFVMKSASDLPYRDAYALYPEIRFVRCRDFTGYFGGHTAEVFFEQCRIARLTGSKSGAMPGALSFSSCKFEADVKASAAAHFMLASTLGTSFVNSLIYAPRVDGIARPELIDQTGFMVLNKRLQYNHINTRLGNDVLSYLKTKALKLNGNFISMLKSHHELEADHV